MREKSARFLDIEMLGEIQRVVVSIPGKKSAFAEFGSEFERGMAVYSYGERPAAFIKPGRIGDAINFRTGNLCQARHDPLHQ